MRCPTCGDKKLYNDLAASEVCGVAYQAPCWACPSCGERLFGKESALAELRIIRRFRALSEGELKFLFRNGEG